MGKITQNVLIFYSYPLPTMNRTMKGKPGLQASSGWYHDVLFILAITIATTKLTVRSCIGELLIYDIFISLFNKMIWNTILVGYSIDCCSLIGENSRFVDLLVYWNMHTSHKQELQIILNATLFNSIYKRAHWTHTLKQKCLCHHWHIFCKIEIAFRKIKYLYCNVEYGKDLFLKCL